MKTSTTTTNSKNLTMESLALPRELYWDGKDEPTSPSELFSISDLSENWLNDDNFANDKLFTNTDVLELKPGFEFLHELINGDDLVVELQDLKDEHWNDIKLESPHPPLDIGTIISHPSALTKVQIPFNIGAFDANSFETAVLTQLTPPHSPPQCSASPAFQLPLTENPTNINDVRQQSPTPISEPVTVQHSNASLSAQNFSFSNWNNNQQNSNVNTLISNDDIEREMQIVDEIVNIRAKELADWSDEFESLSSCSVPSQAESTTDEEWVPISSCSSVASSPLHITSEEQLLGAKISTQKKRTRPYGRGVEDRKIRKKEQNKNAATRYRQKKKLEMEHVLSEEQVLTERNTELKRILADRKREAKYLKTLIREFYQKK